jgi:carbonic anhydrase
MRNLIAFLACLFVLNVAIAQDHGAPAHSAAAASSSHAMAKEPVKGAIKASAPQAASAFTKEEMDEAELSQRIADRLAAMRAKQAQRIARNAPAAKAARARKAEHAEVMMAPRHSEHWSYEGVNGPANWGKINADWIKCGNGNRQSPIDIRNGIKVELEQISFDYSPTNFSVVDNGHTVQVTVGGGNYVTVMNRMYELQQFHFHRPSEERINGRNFEMVVHLVHKDAEGRLAVIAVLVERGKAQSLIQTVWNNLPLEKNDVISPTIVMDVSELLPTRRDYFTYMGSLTTPPCSENVLWMVMKEPVQASAAQMALFSRLYPLNARPVQSTAGRMIKESN